MVALYEVEQTINTATLYVLVPYGQQQQPGGISFSGVSSVAEISLGLANIGKMRALITTNQNGASSPLLGVVRWGYSGTADDGSPVFVEKGWDTLKLGARVIDYADIPSGCNMEIRVRWNRAGIDWSVLYQ